MKANKSITMETIDTLNEQMQTLEYLAEAENKPGLSSILLNISMKLEIARDDLILLTPCSQKLKESRPWK